MNDDEFNFSQKELVAQERALLTINITHVSNAIKNAYKYTGFDELIDGVTATTSFTVNKVVNKTTKTGKPYLLLMATCLKSGTKANLFLWDGNAKVKAGADMIAPIVKKGDFHTVKL